MNQIILSKLKNLNEHNFVIEDTTRDFPGFPDVTAIKNISISGTSKFNQVTLSLSLIVNCDCYMLTSDLCEDIVVPLRFNLDLVFANNEDGDYPLEPIIDLDEIIIGNILAETPYTITKNSFNK